MNIPDKIYNEWIKETTGIIKADMNAVQVVGELTRALKRIVNANGGTVYIADGISYDINGQRMQSPPTPDRCECGHREDEHDDGDMCLNRFGEIDWCGCRKFIKQKGGRDAT